MVLGLMVNGFEIIRFDWIMWVVVDCVEGLKNVDEGVFVWIGVVLEELK